MLYRYWCLLLWRGMGTHTHTHTHTQGQRDEDVESWEKVDFILLLYRLLWRKKRMRYGRCVCVCVCAWESDGMNTK